VKAGASDYLECAEHHLARVQRAKDEPTDWYDLTIYGFYCVEAAVMAAASHVGSTARIRRKRKPRFGWRRITGFPTYRISCAS
jgi:hypothetical protein